MDQAAETLRLLLDHAASDAEQEQGALRAAGLAFSALRVDKRQDFERAPGDRGQSHGPAVEA